MQWISDFILAKYCIIRCWIVREMQFEFEIIRKTIYTLLTTFEFTLCCSTTIRKTDCPTFQYVVRVAKNQFSIQIHLIFYAKYNQACVAQLIESHIKLKGAEFESQTILKLFAQFKINKCLTKFNDKVKDPPRIHDPFPNSRSWIQYNVTCTLTVPMTYLGMRSVGQ